MAEGRVRVEVDAVGAAKTLWLVLTEVVRGVKTAGRKNLNKVEPKEDTVFRGQDALAEALLMKDAHEGECDGLSM
jgi:hypothetical protein